MVSYFGKYKALIIVGLLAGYLAGTFQNPFLEGLHTMVHITQFMLSPPQEQHFYSHHLHDDQVDHVHQHQHTALNFLSSLLDRFSNNHNPTKDQQDELKKKNPEIIPSIRPIAFFSFFHRAKPLFYAFSVLSISPSIPSPPPKQLINRQ